MAGKQGVERTAEGQSITAARKPVRRLGWLLGCFLAASSLTLAMLASAGASDINFPLFPVQQAEQRIWRPYTELTFHGGGDREMGNATLFLPILQDETQLVFADLRGRIFDDSSAEGNWGLAYRQLRPSGWIVGAYAFYDLRKSAFDNTWHQGTFGGELMNLDWDLRMNGYLAEGGAQSAGAPTAFLWNGTIGVANSLERAYSGFDGEIGRLLWSSAGGGDVEVRGYVGGYHFDRDAAGFPDVSGPRARIEMRLYDLKLLGPDSRLTLGYQFQYDDVRDSQSMGLLTLRVPFGRGGGDSGRRLTPIGRRMVEPIVRDVDVVSAAPQGGGTIEQGQMHGVDIASATQIDGGDLAAEVAARGANSVVIATGEFNPAGTITLNENQALLGGGGSLEVTTASGLRATFTAPGARPTISGVLNDANDTADVVIGLAENSTLSGVNINAGEVGVYGNGVNGITVVDNGVSNMTDDDIAGNPPIAGHGIHLNGNVSGNVTSNTLTNNQGSGLHLTGNTVTGGTIANNTIDGQGNGVHGIYLQNFAGGVISGNVIRNYDIDLTGLGVNDDAYLSIDTMTGGTISNNVIENNTVTADSRIAALRIGTLSGGTITNNAVNGNTVNGDGDVAALYVGTMTGGTVSNNTVNDNVVNAVGGVAAMFVDDMQGGTVTGNTVNGNTATGNMVGAFAAMDMSGGTVTGNTVDGNTANATVVGAGFGVLNSFSGGEISGNTVSNNTNTAGVAPDAFNINGFSGTAQLNNNTATNNSGRGYEVAGAGGTATGNTGSGNTGGQNAYP